jgi:hypothetical protein
MTLKYKAWEELNEANIIDKIKDWFSSNFGGPVGELEDCLEEYRSAEMQYVDEWEKIKEEIDKMELQKDQTKADPAESKKLERYLDRAHDSLAKGEKAHAKRVEEIMVKARKIIGTDKRLRSFWELNKTRTDAEIAEDMYKKSKSLSDTRESGTLYAKYKAAVLRSKQKDNEFKEKYGELLYGNKKPDNGMDNVTPGRSTIDTMKQYLAMNLDHFTKAMEDVNPVDAKAIVSYLTKERNQLYVDMDMEKETLAELIKKKSGVGATQESADKKAKEIRTKYMDRIRNVRSKITIARKHV